MLISLFEQCEVVLLWFCFVLFDQRQQHSSVMFDIRSQDYSFLMQLIKFQQTRSDLHRHKLKSLFGDFFAYMHVALFCPREIPPF